MGLLEKALQYKQEINKKGKETLIDTIIGPAETEFISKEKNKVSSQQNGDSTIELDQEDLKSLDSVDDELFILPDDSYEATSAQKIEQSVDFDTTLEKQDETLVEEPEYLGPEDEPDITVLQDDSQHEIKSAREEKKNKESDINPKFRIIDSQADSTTADDSMQKIEPLVHATETEFSMKTDKKFQDFVVLFEIGKEIVKSHSLNELYDTILFSVMGQIGSASATLLVLNQDEDALVIADSRGITIKNKNIRFDIQKGLFSILMQSKGVVDIEQFRQDPQYRDEYYQLIAIDARLFVPLRYNSKVYGALVLGEKITIGNYSEEEIDFIEQISEYAAIAYEKVHTIERLEHDVQRLVDDKNFWNSLDDYKRQLRSYPHKDYFITTAQEMMKSNGFLSYAIFIKNNKESCYSLLLTDEDDTLLLSDTVPSIKSDGAFIHYISSLHGATEIEDFDRNKIIREAFNESVIRKMIVFWINPVTIAKECIGFACVFRLRDYQQKDMQFDRFTIISDVLMTNYFSSLLIQSQYINYVDVVLPIYDRINRELINAERLSIPITIILFTIKNLKRYYVVQGLQRTKDLMNNAETIITNRLSDGDFASKIDRNKFLIVLVGKNKKFAVPFANALKNEIVQQFSDKELQLLVTFLMAEYPVDGSDLYSLLDAID